MASALDELARRAIAGERVAQDQFVRAIAPRVLKIVRSVVSGSPATIEDVSQECLLQIVRDLADWRGEVDVTHYVARITVRAAVAARTKAKTRQLRHPAVEPNAVDQRTTSLVSFDDRGSRRKELLRDLLASLPEAQAEAMTLRVVLGYSMRELADATGAPINTLRSRLRLAREALRRSIQVFQDGLRGYAAGVSVRPQFRTDAGFDVGVTRTATVAVMGFRIDRVIRGALIDVNGDGATELLVAVGPTADPDLRNSELYAFEMPTRQPSDAAVTETTPALPLVQVPVRSPELIDTAVVGPPVPVERLALSAQSLPISRRGP